jgi:hypothetical protein
VTLGSPPIGRAASRNGQNEAPKARTQYIVAPSVSRNPQTIITLEMEVHPVPEDSRSIKTKLLCMTK